MIHNIPFKTQNVHVTAGKQHTRHNLSDMFKSTNIYVLCYTHMQLIYHTLVVLAVNLVHFLTSLPVNDVTSGFYFRFMTSLLVSTSGL